MIRESTKRCIHRAAQLLRAEGQPAMLEPLEPRALLSNFVYHDLGDLLNPTAPLFVLRPGDHDGPAPTISTDVSAIGDVNGDGFADILVGMNGRGSRGHDDDEGDDNDSQGAGAGEHGRAIAAIFSGRTGELLRTFEDGFSGFGTAVAGVGDLNGDGVPDVLVGSPRFATDSLQGPSNQTGRAYLYSGADGTLLRTFTGAAAGDRFGAAVAGAGDFNHDGTPDLLIGAPGADAGGSDRGQAFVYSGTDGTLLATFSGVTDGDALGFAVAGAGDVDADTFADIILGAPGALRGPQTSPGHAYVYSGQTHAALFTFTGDAAGDWFGFSVAGAGDVNNDGHADLIVGAPSADNGHFHSAGVARVFSGADGAVLFTFRGTAPNNNLGASVAGAGDVNRDGHDDFIVGAPAASPAGHVGVYSGADGTLLAKFSHRLDHLQGGDRLGTSAVALGDVNGDGFIDFAFGATQDANPERNDRSRVYVFSGASAAALLPDGLNDDRDIWGTSGNEGFLILNGQVFLLPSHAGFLSGDRVIDVNQGDTVLGGTDAAGDDAFVWRAGVRTSVASLVMMEDGPMGMFTGLRAVDITDSGLILLERLRDGTTPTTWVLDNGTLRYLFDGVPIAINEARTVVGVVPGTDFHSIIWTSGGGAVDIMGIRAVDMNEAGAIVGTGPVMGVPGSTHAVVWSGGLITDLGAIAGGTNFVPRAISDSGEVVGVYTVVATGATSGFYFATGQGIRDIKPPVTVDAPDAFVNSHDLRLADINNHGLIVGSIFDANRGFFLERMDGPGPFHCITGQRVEITTTADGSTIIVTIDDAGRIVIFRRDPVLHNVTRTDLSDDADVGPVSNIIVFTDPGTGNASVAAVTADGLLLIEPTPGGGWTVRNLTREIPGATPITDSLVTLTPRNALVLLAGTNDAGDVVIYGMTARRDAQGRTLWAYDNLFQTQLRDNGFATPSLSGRLVPYVTPWNGLNLAALDANGRVRVLWTSPAIQGWRETDLSGTAGTPTIVGGVSAYVTPWGGINVTGVDANGDVVVTWWVPQFAGHWEKTNFTHDFGGSRFLTESVMSYVTPWGGLNVGGLTEDGRIVVYWWVPGFQGQWQAATICHPGADPRQVPRHDLTTHVAPDGTIDVAGIGCFGDVLDLRWQPGGEWETTNLS